ncbi:MAG: MerR family transcriptional regulator [Blastochloris sp.]|nr:MerR family transcriptional regulator [Blastochloris sp.]
MTQQHELSAKLLRTGELARYAGVSIRTVQFYDRVGLLKPFMYSEAGQRLYCEADLARLMHILALKRMRLPLEMIRRMLIADRDELALLLEEHKDNLYEQMRELSRAIERMEAAQRALLLADDSVNESGRWHIVEYVVMNEFPGWLDGTLDASTRDALVAHQQLQTLAYHKQVGEAWRVLIHEVALVRQQEASPDVVKALIVRWDSLISAMAAGNRQAATDLNKAYANVRMDDLQASEATEWLRQVREVARFIMAARGG